MNNDFYQTIFKRKSFHLFRGVGDEKLTNEELEGIKKAYDSFEKLCPEIKTEIKIVSSISSARRDAEYFIYIYSEEKPNYLMNVGYLGEQLDLYLTKNNIGSLWLGLGKTNEKELDGMKFVIMLAIHKVSDESMYRKDMFKAKRKELNEIWKGDTLGIGEIVRFAPSACNSQPWIVENKDGTLFVTRFKKQTKIGLLNSKAAYFYNRIDIGIFLCFLEVCLAEKNIKTERKIFIDEQDREFNPIGEYKIIN